MHPECIWQPAAFIPVVPKACTHCDWYLSVPAKQLNSESISLLPQVSTELAQRSSLFVWHSGGWNWGMPTLPCVSNISVSKPECSLHWGWCEIFSFSEGRCLRGSPGLMEKAVFLVFCHAEGGSAIYDWFNVFIYIIQLQNVLELMQGITKQLEKTVPPVCEGKQVLVQQGQPVVQELCREQLPRVFRAKALRFHSKVIALVTNCCSAPFTGHWAGMTWECSDQLPWQAVTMAGPIKVLQYFLIFFLVILFLKSASAYTWSYKYCNNVKLFQCFKKTIQFATDVSL